MTNEKQVFEKGLDDRSGRIKASQGGRAMLKSPAAKVFLLGVLTVLLLVPSMFVWALIEERADRARTVAGDIARSWGALQIINGPYLAIPFTETVIAGDDDKRRKEVRHRTAVLFPERLEIKGTVGVAERRKSIYTLPVYKGDFALKGHFETPPESLFEPQDGGVIEISMEKARIVVGISDVRALRSEVVLGINASTQTPFEPGLGPLAAEGGAGINAAVPAGIWQNGFSFDLAMQLNGSSALNVAPAGQTTMLNVQSDWPHPGFTGAFLPDHRKVTDSGFSAQWTIPYLARGIPKNVETRSLPLSGRLMGVKFVDPVDVYQTVSRSLKYSIGFISMVFLAVFVLEMRSGWHFHWIQYGLVGCAVIIFYVMLLAFAEHIGYGPAYLIAAAAATFLNATYVGSSLGSRLAGLVMATVLSAIFAVLYALMREQDYALLIGSVIAFAALAVTMFATQRIDWSGVQAQQPGQPA